MCRALLSLCRLCTTLKRDGRVCLWRRYEWHLGHLNLYAGYETSRIQPAFSPLATSSGPFSSVSVGVSGDGRGVTRSRDSRGVAASRCDGSARLAGRVAPGTTT